MAYDDDLRVELKDRLWGSWLTDSEGERTNQLNTRFVDDGALVVEVLAADRVTPLESWRVDLVQVENRRRA